MTEQTRRFTTRTGTVYSNTFVKNEQGKIIFSNWKRGNKLLEDAVYVSADYVGGIRMSGEIPEDLFEEARKLDYMGDGGFIVLQASKVSEVVKSSLVKTISPEFDLKLEPEYSGESRGSGDSGISQ